jgi:hypothetical protein
MEEWNYKKKIIQFKGDKIFNASLKGEKKGIWTRRR